jgi:hypothetical protein
MAEASLKVTPIMSGAPYQTFVFLPLFAAVAIGWWILRDRWNRERIRRYFEDRGDAIIDLQWEPFARWFGEKNVTHYRVWYEDREGGKWECLCKTSMWIGVYTTDDRMYERSRDTGAEGDLREENRRLKEQVRRLRDGV